MAATLTVPTVFKAVDKFSTVVKNMAKSVGGFTKSAGSSFMRFGQKFNNFFKLGDLQKQLLSFAGTAAIAGAIVSGIVFSGKSLIDYEKNVAAVHGILNQLSDKDFKKFNNEIDKVAKQTQYSAVEVASSFQKIAELNIDLAKTPESLGATARAAITLSRASGMELTPATESLVAIMAQFHLQGTDANRVINTLAAGLKYGSATIQDQADAFKNWGTVAQTANLSIEQAVALTQVLGKYQLKGEEAGTALRGTIIRLQKAHLGYASGLFNVNDALAEANKHYSKLARARDKDNYLIKLFGIRQIIAGRLLLQNIDRIKELTTSVTNTNQAQEQAAIKTDTVAGAWQRLSASFVNYITGNDTAKAGLTKLKEILRYVADNMDRIIDTVISVVKWFLILKGAWLLLRGAIALYNVVSLIAIARTAGIGAAMASQSAAALGFGNSLSAISSSAVAANGSMAALISTIGGFVVPAAVLAFVGYQAYKGIFKDINERRAETSGGYANYWDYADAKSPDRFLKQNMAFWNARKAQKATTSQEAQSALNGFRMVHPDLPGFGKDGNEAGKAAPILRLPTDKELEESRKTVDNNIHIFLNDPGNNVSQIKSDNPKIPITLSPTTGPQGKK